MPEPNPIITAACDHVVASTKAYHLALNRRASTVELTTLARRQADAVHYLSVVTRKVVGDAS